MQLERLIAALAPTDVVGDGVLEIRELAYDAVHTEIFPVALGTLGILAGSSGATKVGLIWLAHIGADRLSGYGLKYPTAFKDTHLSRV